jgi:hypothetical protein
MILVKVGPQMPASTTGFNSRTPILYYLAFSAYGRSFSLFLEYIRVGLVLIVLKPNKKLHFLLKPNSLAPVF